MASYNLATIRAIVRTRGDYPSPTRYTDAYVNGEIQAAYSEWYELIADTYEGWFDTKTNLPTIVGQDYIALLANCWRVKGLDRQDGNRWIELHQVGIGDRNRYVTDLGLPHSYVLTARGADLYQTPDSVYTLRLSFTPTVTPLDETAVTDFHNDWQEYVIESAILRLHKRSERPAYQETYQRLFDPENGMKARIVKGASKRKQQEPEYLQLRETSSWPWWIY